MTVTEPEWDDEDRAQLEALALIEADECPSCHGSLTETTSIDADDDWDVHRTRCHRCTAILEVQAVVAADKEERQTQALLWSAVRRS